eukprot:13059441-Alexandrium_andersonii.AAC.1
MGGVGALGRASSPRQPSPRAPTPPMCPSRSGNSELRVFRRQRARNPDAWEFRVLGTVTGAMCEA